MYSVWGRESVSEPVGTLYLTFSAREIFPPSRLNYQCLREIVTIVYRNTPIVKGMDNNNNNNIMYIVYDSSAALSWRVKKRKIRTIRNEIRILVLCFRNFRITAKRPNYKKVSIWFHLLTSCTVTKPDIRSQIGSDKIWEKATRTGKVFIDTWYIKIYNYFIIKIVVTHNEFIRKWYYV